MKKTLFAVVALCCGVILGDAALPPSPAVSTPGQTQGRRKRKRLTPEQQMEKFGGFVYKPYAGRVCTFMNAQTRVPDAPFDWCCQQISQVLSLPLYMGRTTVSDNDNFSPIRAAYADVKNTGAVVSIVDLPGWPSLLVAPEDGWVQVNVGALAKDDPGAEVLEKRVKKELWRAVVLLFGGGNSMMMHGDLMRPINSLRDLDEKQNLAPGPEPFNVMIDGARARGISPIYRTTYRQACVEGWAPAPTNDFQRAIFERVKSDKERGPMKPIAITPPAKK